MSIFKPKAKNSLKREIIALIPIILLALLFRSVFYEPYKIPSHSMNPNLIKGDYILVSKYIYGISHHSFPFSLKFFSDRKFVIKKPEAGDIAVFRLPGDEKTKYIKRVIGVPGDRIQLVGGRLYINRNLVKREFISRDYNHQDGRLYEKYRETLANNKYFDIVKISDDTVVDNTKIFEVPAKHYFFLGDNRNNSKDSRFQEVGFIPEENLMGEAQFILFSSDSAFYKIWSWISNFDYSRMLKNIRPVSYEVSM